MGHLNVDDMIFYLPDLVDKAEKMMETLAPALEDLDTHLHNIQKPGSQMFRKVRRALQPFDDVKKLYGQEEMVDPSVALRGLFGAQDLKAIGDGPWRPDDAIYKANLATLLDLFTPRSAPADRAALPLERLDRCFPQPFSSRIHGRTGTPSTGSSSLSNETFEMALAIRVHFAIQVLKAKQGDLNFDPDMVINQIFFDPEDTSKLRSWRVEGLGPSDMGPQRRRSIPIVIDSIKSTFSEDDNSVDHARLERLFPLQSFFTRLVTWTRLRNNEINERLAGVGGSDGLQDRVDVEIQRQRAVAEGRDPPREVHFNDELRRPTGGPSTAPPKMTSGRTQLTSAQTLTSPEAGKTQFSSR